MKKKRSFKTKKVLAVFSGIFFLAGFTILNKNMTGNLILEEGGFFDVTQILGAVLVLCSMLLALFSLKKR